MTTPANGPDIEQIWKGTLEKIKVRLVMPGVWRAMEAARPLVIENGILVLGFPASRSHEGGLLKDSKTNNIIERALEEEAGQPLRLRTIEGETLDDWQTAKLRDEQATALQRAAAEKRRREQSADQGWDGIIERLTRQYADMPMRQLPQMQAIYLDEAIRLLADAARRLLGDSPAEADQRSFARALDRVADRTQVPAAIVAYLVRQKAAE